MHLPNLYSVLCMYNNAHTLRTMHRVVETVNSPDRVGTGQTVELEAVSEMIELSNVSTNHPHAKLEAWRARRRTVKLLMKDRTS